MLYRNRDDLDVRIFRPDDQSSTPLQTVVCNAVWRDAHTLIGEEPEVPEHSEYSSCDLQIIDDQGKLIRKIHAENPDTGGESMQFYAGHTWYCLPGNPATMLLQTQENHSDGPDFACYRVDMRTGKAKQLMRGILVGIAPDGSQAAFAEPHWIGPYKHGGVYAAPLTILSIASGRTENVGDPFSCVWPHACWSASLVPQAGAKK